LSELNANESNPTPETIFDCEVPVPARARERLTVEVDDQKLAVVVAVPNNITPFNDPETFKNPYRTRFPVSENEVTSCFVRDTFAANDRTLITSSDPTVTDPSFPTMYVVAAMRETPMRS